MAKGRGGLKEGYVGILTVEAGRPGERPCNCWVRVQQADLTAAASFGLRSRKVKKVAQEVGMLWTSLCSSSQSMCRR